MKAFSILLFYIYFIVGIVIANDYNSCIIELNPNKTLDSQINKKGTTYLIRNKFDLNGSSYKLPQNITLIFENGLITNGEIIFDKTKLINPSFEKMRFKGSVNEEKFIITNYGAKSGRDMDCSIIINDLIKLQNVPNLQRNSKTIYIPNGTFYIDNPIILFAGWEAPIVLEGNGITSTLCQRKNNEHIIKIYENHHIKNLNLVYKNKQSFKNSKSIAIACQRAIFCQFENITISKANTGFGYISIAEANKDNLTKIKDQAYVSCNFRNIRIYEFSNYAFDFNKEINQGDSGSVFDNIYINSNSWLNNSNTNIAKGAIRGFNSVIVITQINIEGDNYTNALIELKGMSRISAKTLHLEGLKQIPTIIRAQIQSIASFDIIDIQRCSYELKHYALIVENKSFVSINHLLLREDCIISNSQHKAKLINHSTPLKSARHRINYILDPNNIYNRTH